MLPDKRSHSFAVLDIPPISGHFDSYLVANLDDIEVGHAYLLLNEPRGHLKQVSYVFDGEQAFHGSTLSGEQARCRDRLSKVEGPCVLPVISGGRCNTFGEFV